GKMEVVFALFFLQKYDIFNLRYENRLDSLNKTDRVYRVRSSEIKTLCYLFEANCIKLLPVKCFSS
ncbi:MAG: hypothetical protein PHN55_06930, partial [Dysgonamonadaceae bacterium]|nr:hypothetical protein [Dysgonamonadaceae bacterium]